MDRERDYRPIVAYLVYERPPQPTRALELRGRAGSLLLGGAINEYGASILALDKPFGLQDVTSHCLDKPSRGSDGIVLSLGERENAEVSNRLLLRRVLVEEKFEVLEFASHAIMTAVNPVDADGNRGRYFGGQFV
jgi:hypothetical protein